MRNILAFLAASVICIAGLGYYLGWYSVQSSAGAAGKRQVNIDIDSRKISDDLQKGTEKIQQVIDQSRGADSTNPTTKLLLSEVQPAQSQRIVQRPVPRPDKGIVEDCLRGL